MFPSLLLSHVTPMLWLHPAYSKYIVMAMPMRCHYTIGLGLGLGERSQIPTKAATSKQHVWRAVWRADKKDKAAALRGKMDLRRRFSSVLWREGARWFLVSVALIC